MTDTLLQTIISLREETHFNGRNYNANSVERTLKAAADEGLIDGTLTKERYSRWIEAIKDYASNYPN